ncbi:general secretion pathway protein GspB [Thiohalocapsa sp. ML1]|uniref:general secretion pathway protein GspB n=1 Tax=Thiohalocapsa sp. ML1 TaxID=1431688 RepID=UPI0007320B2E|nr:general secretion pathway protein GspB [Thiohalocapsa sp. ML1]
MSYILEALKKSQSDRELGQVPRIEGFGRDVPIEPPRSNLGAYLALLLALLALGIAVLLLLRTLLGTPETAGDGVRLPPPTAAPAERLREPPRPDASGLATDASAPPRPRAGFTDPAATPEPLPELLLPPVSAPAPAAAPADALGSAPSSTPAAVSAPQPSAPAPQGTAAAPPAAPMPFDDPAGLSVEPEVLVVPAPAPPGEPLPRGADELRRALLGDGERVSASVDSGGNAPPAPPPPLRGGPAASEQTPVPEDLIAEIEAFKELVRKRDPGIDRRAAARPPPLPEPPGLPRPQAAVQRAEPLPAGPSLDLRSRLPPISMNVHVYNADPSRRFVYINGRKLTEQEKSREGIRLERVVADGAVLSFEGEEFFQRR